jgi:hypothetical protein
MIQPRAYPQVRFTAHKGLHRGPFLPRADAPPGVVRVGEGVRAEIAFRFLCLLNGGDGIGKEFIQECPVLEPEPGHHDNWH